MKRILLVAALCAGLSPASAQEPQAGATSKVVVLGSACDEGQCSDAPPAVYECVAAALTPDPVTHGRIYDAIQRVNRNPDMDTAERLKRLIERPSCDAKSYRIRLGALYTATERTPFLGRKVVATGLLVRDEQNILRVQLPDGSSPWTLDPAGVDQELVNSGVTVEGTTISPRRLRATSITRDETTAALLAPTEEGPFIWCRTVGEHSDPVYSSTVFPGDYLKEPQMAAAFGDYITQRYGYRSRYTPACMYENYIQSAFLKLRSSNRETIANQRQVVETEWRYDGVAGSDAGSAEAVTTASTREVVSPPPTPDPCRRTAGRSMPNLPGLGDLGRRAGELLKSVGAAAPAGC